HGTVWVNGDNGYIAMQVSGLEVLPGAGLTDSGLFDIVTQKTKECLVLRECREHWGVGSSELSLVM
ncbi:hypothetical protein BIS10_15890, partial [Halomonas sp. 707B3]|nr:hypothetical protein [Halomonas sp. 707B3]